MKILRLKVLIRVQWSKCGLQKTIQQRQLGDEEVFNNVAPPLKTINAVMSKVRKWGSENDLKIKG